MRAICIALTAALLQAFTTAYAVAPAQTNAGDSVTPAPSYIIPSTVDSIKPYPINHIKMGDDLPTVNMSLERCIEIALSENPTIHVADMEITRMDYSKKEVIGQLFPTISFMGAYNATIAKQTMYFDMSAMAGGGSSSSSGESEGSAGEGSSSSSSSSSSSNDNGIKMGLDNSWQVGFTAGMPIIAPQLWKSLKLSDTQILEKLEDARSSRINLVSQVKSAYYAMLLAMDSYQVILDNLSMAQFTAELYKKKFEYGAASEFDVLRTEVAVKNIEPELLQAEISIKQAKLQLLLLMGMAPTVDIAPTVSLATYEDTMFEDVLHIDRTDISGNCDLRKLEIQTTLLDQALEVKKMAWWPTLSLSANYLWTSMSNGSPFSGFRWNPYSVIGLTLNLPLFNGGQRLNAIKQAQVQVQEMEWQREYLTSSINMQVDIALDNIYKNIRTISSSSESVAQATRAHDIMQQSFEIGAATYLDLRDSELALTRSRLSYYQSIYNYLVARNNLELLLGTYDVTPYMPAR